MIDSWSLHTFVRPSFTLWMMAAFVQETTQTCNYTDDIYSEMIENVVELYGLAYHCSFEERAYKHFFSDDKSPSTGHYVEERYKGNLSLRFPSSPWQLAFQWMQPRPGLGLDPGMPSNLAREGSLMKSVEENLAKGDAYELAKLHVRRHMVVHGLNARKDTEEIKKRLLQEELAKMNIFSIGSSGKTD